MITVQSLPSKVVPYIEGYIAGQQKNERNPEDFWDFYPESELEPMFVGISGQHRTTKFGYLITVLMANSDSPRKWMEIGAWNGKGTTACLLDGLRMRSEKENVQIVSYEADPFFYKIALQNVENNQFFGNQFHLVHGRLPGSFEFPSEETIPESEKGIGGHFHLNYEREKVLFQTIQQVSPPFPPEVVILDGGEYSGYFDWLAIDKATLKFVFLDDICVFKNRAVYRELETDPTWELWNEDKTEGNGWAVFQKKHLV